MTAIVAGQGLGLFNTSRGLLGGQGQLGTAQYGRTGEQFYVNATNGNLVVQQQDEWLVGAGVDADFLRTYNSQGGGADDNGDNWRIALSRKVYGLTGTRNQANSYILRVDADGNVAKYDYISGIGLYVSTSGSGAYDTLAFADNKWTWTDGDTRQIDVYESDTSGGKLTETQDRDGNKTGLYYDGSGRLTWVVQNPGAPETQDVVQLSYDAAGNLTELLTIPPQGGAISRRVTYAYDNANRLQKVTIDLTPENSGDSSTDSTLYTTTYTYVDNTSRLLKTVSHSDGGLNGGGALLEFTYDTLNRVKSVKDVRGSDGTRETIFDYQVGKTVVTDGAGGTVELAYDTSTATNEAARAGQLKSVKALSSGTVVSSVFYEYSAAGDLLSVTDHYSNKTTYGYDAAGNRTYERDAAGNVVDRLYSWSNQLLRETVYAVADGDGAGPNPPLAPLVTRYTYDDSGKHLRFVVSPEGRVTEYRYNSLGQRVAELQFTGNSYPVSALQPTDLIALGTLVTWADGTTKAQWQRTDFTYDFRGQLSQQTRYSKVDVETGAGQLDGYQNTTQYFYDQAGRLLKSIDGNQAWTGYLYDGLNRLKTQRGPDGTVTTYTYIDAPGSTGPQTIISRQDSAGGNLGRVTAQTYDASGALIGLLELDQLANYQLLAATAYSYDKVGRLLRVTSAGGQQTYYLYDAVGRKVAEIDPARALTEYVYDGNGRLQSTVRYATAVSSSIDLATNFDKLVLSGAVSPKVAVRPTQAAQDRVACSFYDKAGRLAKTVDAEGAVVLYEYDGASRLVRTTAYSTVLTSTQVAYIQSNLGTVAWDNTTYTVPTQTAAEADANRISRLLYDNDGRVAALLDAEGAFTRNTYDAAGRLTQVRQYYNAVPAAQRNGDLAQLTSSVVASDAQDMLTAYGYDAAGRQNAMFVAVKFSGTQHVGYLTTFAYDGAGNRCFETRHAGEFFYTAGTSPSSLAPVTLNAETQVTYQAYDGYGRVYLKQVRSEAQRLANDFGMVTYYAYDAAGNLIQTIDGLSAGQDERRATRRYDALGRVTAELGAVGSKLMMDTLAANLTKKTEASALYEQRVTEFEYDILDRQITRKEEQATVFTVGEASVDRRPTETRQYDKRGRLVEVKAPDGGRTLSYWDALDRKVAELGPTGALTTYLYNKGGDLLSQKVYADGAARQRRQRQCGHL